MILQRTRIIEGDAEFEPGTSVTEVWCATNEPPHPHEPSHLRSPSPIFPLGGKWSDFVNYSEFFMIFKTIKITFKFVNKLCVIIKVKQRKVQCNAKSQKIVN